MKIQIPLSTGPASNEELEYFVPKHANILHVFTPPITKGRFHAAPGDSLGIIPHRSPEVIQELSKIKLIGWDFAPEHFVKEPNCLVDVFVTTTHQYPVQAIELLESKGYTCVRLDLTVEQFSRLTEVLKTNPPSAAPYQSHKQLYYFRLRYLYKVNKASLSEWESKFVQSIGTQLAQNKKLTDPQVLHVQKLLDKYKVGLDSTASSKS